MYSQPEIKNIIYFSPVDKCLYLYICIIVVIQSQSVLCVKGCEKINKIVTISKWTKNIQGTQTNLPNVLDVWNEGDKDT